MIVLDDNNSCVEPTHLMVTLAVVTTWYSQIDACRWCSWSLGELMMVPWWFDWLWWWRWSLFDVVEPRWWRWSVFDDDAAWRCLDDALCLHSLHWCMWLDPMPYDALEPWVSLMMEVWWLLDEFRPCWWWHDTFMWLMWCFDEPMSLDEFRPCLGCWWGSLTPS